MALRRLRLSVIVVIAGSLLLSSKLLGTSPVEHWGGGGLGGETGQLRLVVQNGSMGILSAAVSRTARYIATSGISNDTVLWETKSGREVRRFKGIRADFSPDEKSLVTVFGNAIVWDLETGKRVVDLSTSAGPQVYEISSAIFSPDGRFILSGGTDNVASLWDVSTGQRRIAYSGLDAAIVSVAYSPDGAKVAAVSIDGRAVVWETATSHVIRELSGLRELTASLVFTEDSSNVLTISNDNTVLLSNLATGREMRRFVGQEDQIYHMDVSPDQRLVGTAGLGKGDEGSIILWDLATGKIVSRFDRGIAVIVFSRDGKHLLVGNKDKKSLISCNLIDLSTMSVVQQFNNQVSGRILLSKYAAGDKKIITELADSTVIWDLEKGHEEARFNEDPDRVTSLDLSSDGRLMAISSNSSSIIRIVDTTSGVELNRFGRAGINVTQLEFTSDSDFVVTGNGKENTVSIWSVATGQELRKFTGGSNFAMNYAGNLILIGAKALAPDFSLWDLKTGGLLHHFGHDDVVFEFAITSTGRYIVSAGKDGTLRVWETSSGREVRRNNDHAPIMSLGLSNNGGRYAVTGNALGEVELWDLNTGETEQQLTGHSFPPLSVFFSSDGSEILSASFDGSTRLWDRTTGKQICQLYSFDDGTWVVVDPNGHFDSNNLDEIRYLHWIMPDDPLKALPLEIFMRDYYEPGLLSRLLSGEQFKILPNLASLNRVQPLVKITNIVRQSDNPDLVTVTVDVAKAKSERQRDKQGSFLETGVYDLRLFRDGQIVGQTSDGEVQNVNPASRDNEKLTSWRKEAIVKLDPNGSRKIIFKNIKLPRQKDIKQVEFSAYAFNEDRVKSQTDRRTFDIPADLSPRKGRAYIISAGINAYENPSFDLRYSVNDARAIQQTMFDELTRIGSYTEVVQIPLISDYKLLSDKRELTERTATKTNFKAVLDLLAGRAVDAAIRKQIPNADKLQQASPEDLVLISFSSHGYADNDGNFFFVMYDTGKGTERKVTDELLRHSVSSEELSLWLRDVDAGEMLMIVDACHSAAAIQGKEFKPGPMGSRGLGQLSYDKGMRILTATQADDVALGAGTLKQGLLTYSLIRDGLDLGKADSKPKDGKITVSEWLQYGEGRVPKLYEEIMTGAQPSEIKDLVQRRVEELKTQRPSLFDFSRKRHDAVIVKQ